MDNGTSAAVVEQFDELALLPNRWDHNRHYHDELLRRVGRGRRRAVDLGCGTGELTRALAVRCASVVGVDASGGMIREARRRNWGLNVEYVEGDAEAFLRGRSGQLDCVVSVAALHHMDEARMLGLCREALAPGGVLVILDLFRDSGILDRAASLAASVANPFFYLAKTGKPGIGLEEREAWSAHGPQDHYLSLRELRAAARRELGEFRLERKLFWRYLLSYERPRFDSRNWATTARASSASSSATMTLMPPDSGK
jgi:SAM-dependent methyltransferase